MLTAELLNFTAVSEKLYISQSAVSRQIKNLEEELGFSLLLRSNNVLQLTEAGKVMYEAFRDMYDRMQTGLNDAEKVINTNRLSLNVSFTGEVLFDVMWEKYFRNFEVENPDVQVHYTYRNPTEERYDEIGADLLFVHGYALEHLEGLTGTKLFETDGFFYVDRCHPVAKRGYFKAEDFDKYPFLTLYSKRKFLVVCKNVLSYFHTEPKKIIQVGSSHETIIHLLRDQAIACGDQYTYRLDTRFVRIPLPKEVKGIGYWLYWKPSNPNPILPFVIENLREKVIFEE